MNATNASAQAEGLRDGSVLEALNKAIAQDGTRQLLSARQAHLQGSTQQRARVQPKTSMVGVIRSLTLAGPAGQLEAVLNQGAPHAHFAALLCHPHPLGGGNLHNKVVYHAMKVLNDSAWGLGLPVLRFNFRGVGRSHGVHDGEAETGDVLTAIEFLRHELRLPLIVAGFSFGAAIAFRACCLPGPPQPDVRALIALGLPTESQGSAYQYGFLKRLALPKLFLSGEHDQFAPRDQLAQVAAAAADPKRLILLGGCDHFFTGQLEPMQRALAAWLKEQFS